MAKDNNGNNRWARLLVTVLAINFAFSSWVAVKAVELDRKLCRMEGINKTEHRELVKDDAEQKSMLAAQGIELRQVHGLVKEIGWKVGVDRPE